LSDINENVIFSTEFSKNTQILNSMEIRQVTADLFLAVGRTDSQTDLMKLIGNMLNFRTLLKMTEMRIFEAVACILKADQSALDSFSQTQYIMMLIVTVRISQRSRRFSKRTV